MEEIVIPNLDDDDDETYALPPFARPSFGSSSTTSLPDTSEASNNAFHRSQPSTDSPLPRYGLPSNTPPRPHNPQSSASYSVGIPTPSRPTPFKLNNGSTSSLITPGTSIGSNPGLSARKGSFASLKNAFIKSAPNPVPPVPSLNSSAYPALKNPFSRFEAPSSPVHSRSPGPGPHGVRKQSTASFKSAGGRSNASGGSSSWKDETRGIPPLPPIPTRGTPSRMWRMGSDAGSSVMYGGKGGSVSGIDDLGKTPGEEALRAVFKDFKESANGKITRICARPLNTHPSLPATFESGVDPPFDTLLFSLAHCGKRHPRHIIDLLTQWSKSHSEGINAAEVRAHLDRSMGLQMRVEDAAAILGARKSSAARYVLNRALIEVVRVVPRGAMGEELGMTLEGNAFAAYVNRMEKDEGGGNPHRKAVAQLQVELLGELSKTRFLTISDRFTREIGKYTTSQPTKESEYRTEHTLRGMRHLKLKVYPEEDLEISSEFVEALAAFFANTHGQSLKCCYAETLTHLLHSVVETATAEVNHPMWSKAIAVVLSRAIAMAQKPRYWSVAFPLVVVALGVSPREVFMQHWQGCMEAITSRFKDRLVRPIAMNCFIRILWIYLNRCSESSTSMRKRLDPLIRMFFSSPMGLYPPELPLDPFITILQYIMVKQLDYGEDFVVDYLRDGTSRNDGGELPYPGRATALVKAIGYTLKTIEDERVSSWPPYSDFSTFDLEGYTSSGDVLPTELSNKQDVTDFMKKCGPAFMSTLLACDRSVSLLLLSNDAVTLSAHASSTSMDSSSEYLTRKHGDIHVSYPTRFDPVLRLFASLLDVIPRCLPTDASTPQIANILCRGTFSADPLVCAASEDAIRRIASDAKQCTILANTFTQFVFETRHVFRDTFVGSRLLDSQFERVGRLWLDILQAMVGHSRMGGGDTEDGGSGSVNRLGIEKVEGCAVFLLCSTSLALRKLAGAVLLAARDLEGEVRRPSAAFRYSRVVPEQSRLSRVAQLYEATWEEGEVASLRSVPWMTSSDRHRLDMVVVKDKTRLVARIAESDNPKDQALWAATLPIFIAKIVDQLPTVASELRAVVTSTVLRLQGHVASVASVSAARATPGMRSSPVALRSTSDTGVLAEYWRNYLSVLCVTMPELGGVPATPPVQRTKEAIILTPDTISSPALFHYLTALLGWEDPRFRDAGIYALGCISQRLMRPLSEVLVNATRRLADGMKASNGSGNGVGSGTPRKTNTYGPLWTAIAHVFRLISPLILDTRSSSHHTNLSSLLIFVKLTYTLLSDSAVKEDYTLQTLRRSFCNVVENLTSVLAKLDSSDRFLGEEMRGGVFKLCAEWCFAGKRDGREILMMKVLGNGSGSGSGSGERERNGTMDDLGAKTKLLSAAAAEAMAGLCQGKLISIEESTPAQQASEFMVDPLTVLRWIRGMFTSSNTIHHETGRKALFALIKHNWSCKRLLDEVLHQSFGEGEQFSLESSFFGVVADILCEGLITLPIEQCACLALSKLGHPVSDIRQRAFQLTVSLLATGEDEASALLLPAMGSTSPNVYRQAQRDIAARLANTSPDKAIAFLGECTIRLSQLEAPRRQATLAILPPWLKVLDLAAEEEESAEQQALSNLMYLAVRFSDDHLEDIQSIFTAFADTPGGSPRNTTTLVKFLFEQGGRRKSTDFVAHAQRVISFLAGSEAGEVIFEEICRFVEPGAMAAVVEKDEGVSPGTSLANLDTVIPAGGSRDLTYSTGQLALLFAGELLPHRLGDLGLSLKLPTLLHVALAHCDHPSSELREACQGVMFQVLRSWIYDTSSIPPDNARAVWAMAERKITDLSRSQNTIFWSNDEVGDSNSAFLAPPKMTGLIMKILGILLPLQPRIRQIWGELALSWATSCPIRHLACRSFQVFRVLSPKISARMISDTLARLSSTIASSSPEIQVFNREVLRTFAVVVQNLSSTEVGGYPQLFWCTVACLSTPFEEEFAEVVELLSHLLDKTNLSDPKVVANLVSFRPPDWVGAEPYLQQLLSPGLRSSKTSLMTFDLIRRLSSASNAELIDSEQGRLINGFITALPWMLQSIDLGEANEDLGMMALDLASIAENTGSPGFTRLLTSFAHMRFRTKDDFVRQAASLLRESLSVAGQARKVMVAMLGFVLNSEEWMREKVLGFLPLVLQHPEARAVMGANTGELLQPLLRLVSTKHASLVLNVFEMPISGSLDGGEIAEAAFGPILSTGWSIPRVKEASALTRENVTAVFNTCAIETRTASAHFSIVQFTDLRGMAQHMNTGQPMARGGSSHSTYMPNDSALSLSSLPSPVGGGAMGMDNASMGDLVGALHSLNQFFDDGLEESPKGAGMGVMKGHVRVGSESASERRIRAIMARGRNPSVTSPIYETSNFSPSTKRHRPTRSDLTDTSLLSDDQSQSATQTQTYGNYRTHHATNMSMSSMTSVISDFDRSENLFGLDEDGQEVVDVIGFGASSLSLGAEIGGSLQGTPVKGRP